MKIEIATLFPEMCEAFLRESIIGRAINAGLIEVNCHNIRDYTENKHRRVDDKPYGGGYGMVIEAAPVYNCVKSIVQGNSRLVFLSPQGRRLDQKLVKEIALEEHLILLCGHYEGIDCRVIEELEFEQISIGDYVVTGGELPALILTDAIARLQHGILPSPEVYENESHWDGTLEAPLYTRPEIWRGRAVPSVLLSGNHAEIEKWKKEKQRKI